MIAHLLFLFQIIGALGLFVFGLKIMSESLQKLSGFGLRKVIKRITRSRVSAIFTGLVLTLIVQSSSATSVMVVSFVNAGLFSFAESMGVIMGCNIGTTFTAWLALLGLKNITNTVICFVGITFPLLFTSKANLRSFAEFAMGLGIIFVGIQYLQEIIPYSDDSQPIFGYLKLLTTYSNISILIFVLFGLLFTAVLQSSSALLVFLIIVLNNGWIDFTLAAAIVLGGNVGTTLTANVAAIFTNRPAKRAALFHFLFNAYGVLLILLVFPYYLQLNDWLYQLIFPQAQSLLINSFTPNNTQAAQGIALFHTLFNLLNTLFTIAVFPLVKNVIMLLLPERENTTTTTLKYFDAAYVQTPDFLIEEAMKETQKMGELVEKMSGNVYYYLFNQVKDADSLLQKILEREKLTDELEANINVFLSKAGMNKMSATAAKKLQDILNIVDDLESIGDQFKKMAAQHSEIQNNTLRFPEGIKLELKLLLETVHQAIELMNKNLNKTSSIIDIEAENNLERFIDDSYEKLRELYKKRIEEGVYSIQEGIVFLDYLRSIEKIGDHIIKVSKILSGERGF